MGIAEDVYERCGKCLREAGTCVTAAAAGQCKTPAGITARRAAADIAADATFALLQNAFITPIDREDLWVMWNGCEAVLRAAEDAALNRLPSGCTAAVAAACDACAAVVEAFPKTEAVSFAMRAIRTAHSACVELQAVVTACESVMERVRYCALKNT